MLPEVLTIQFAESKGGLTRRTGVEQTKPNFTNVTNQ